MKYRRTARKAACKRPARPGSFCANCISTKGPLYMELGWNDECVPVAICESCSTQEGGGHRARLTDHRTQAQKGRSMSDDRPVPKWMCCCYQAACECRWCSHCGASAFGFHVCPDRAAFLVALEHDMLMKDAARRSKTWRSRVAWHLVVHLDWTTIPRIKVSSQP